MFAKLHAFPSVFSQASVVPDAVTPPLHTTHTNALLNNEGLLPGVVFQTKATFHRLTFPSHISHVHSTLRKSAELEGRAGAL